MEIPEEQAGDPLASSPIFAALIHAASCAKDEKPKTGGLQGVPLPDVDSIGESQEEDEFELNHYSGEEEAAVSGRRKRSSAGSGGSGYNNSYKRRWEEPKRAERSIRQRSRPEKVESAAKKGFDDGNAALPGIKGGSSCHQCKSRRMFQDLTYCTSSLENKKKTCRKKYCEHCLTKFYNEPPLSRRDKARWVCPSCRRICCCAACRRKELKQGGGAASARCTSAAPRSSSRSGNVVGWEKELASRKQNGRDSRSVPMDYDAVLDLEELRLMAIARETNASAAAEEDLPVASDNAIDEGPKNHRSVTPSDESANLVEAAEFGRDDSHLTTPHLRCTVAYMLAIAQFGTVKEMLRRIVSRKSVGSHEKVQLISVLLRRIHQKYAALAQQPKVEPRESF
uniref:Zinc-finger domain-containing protein n=2 Tax=Lotharella oceanica TaxID=641309 RepID=A0A7S2TPP0_9EUKA|mmetsp:Transcript_24184/g.45245  ORF Transcript_24184/g.45245 Transcript_24184/m.45245 type:complete len:396 (+) Transcript_24184:78-1265(+)|eukprot:CAMPEP_0170170808 /NCGR_PEP_ID=MMETSP0040_2-20121228/3845_1 /TAXON_ID=641309 /ORGANISM="Lotharella oceanica, Strain CCMP622" /LENGTH=395 /DNA_ID=CAMNT_0010410455 /DNA_START=68 /DNA_END=1255 /DNA_ORIENTATION=-